MSAYDNRLSAFERRIGYAFSDRRLLVRALTHSSYGNGSKSFDDNERLEFLGDRVLGLLTADRLYRDSQDVEGKLARRLNALVRKETCADIARDLDFAGVLRVSKSEDKQNGRDKTSILGDACEAVIAAIYLDGGMKAAQKFYSAHWKSRIAKVVGSNSKDPKTDLQEQAVRRGFAQPEYQVVSRKGPDHRPHFVVQVAITGFGAEQGEGPSKKEAERSAAAALLAKIRVKNVKS